MIDLPKLATRYTASGEEGWLHDFAATLVETLSSAHGGEDFLRGLTRLAVERVRAASSCGVSVSGLSASMLLDAATGEIARHMDDIQHQLQDGPCLVAQRDNVIVEVSDLATDTRWPSLSKRGFARGARTSLSVPLAVGDRAVGTLNLYARVANAFTPIDRARAIDLAAQAAPALSLAARILSHEEQTEHLRTALCSRSVIDQAIGILMGRHRITPEVAFDHLRRLSQTTNTKLREVAAELVAETGGQRPSMSSSSPMPNS